MNCAQGVFSCLANQGNENGRGDSKGRQATVCGTGTFLKEMEETKIFTESRPAIEHRIRTCI
jgi:hypothetical protein